MNWHFHELNIDKSMYEYTDVLVGLTQDRPGGLHGNNRCYQAANSKQTGRALTPSQKLGYQWEQ